MALKVSLLMESLEEAHKFTNLALHMALEAQNRGYNIFYHGIDTMTYRDGKVYASAQSLGLDREFKNFDLGKKKRICLNEMDVALFMIEKMPFDMPFFTITKIMETLCYDTLVVNDPRQIREAANKVLMIDFPEITPPTVITSDINEIRNFQQDHEETIVKPLYGMHGKGIFYLGPDDRNLRTIIETLSQSYPAPWMVQKFIPDIVKGDKRLYLIDGEYVGGLNRVPPENEFRATTYTGGRTEPVELTDRDHEIIEIVGAEMKKRGIIFAGMDVIGSYLTEVNTGCPGGIGYINRYCDTNVQSLGWDAIESRLAKRAAGDLQACA